MKGSDFGACLWQPQGQSKEECRGRILGALERCWEGARVETERIYD